MSIADQYIKSGAARTVLIVGSEICSRIVDWTDRGTCVLFRRWSGCHIVEVPQTRAVFLSTHIHSDGNMKICCIVQTLKLLQNTNKLEPGYDQHAWATKCLKSLLIR